jgi:N-acetylglucosaminyldiphosphoundecaprenol N-acetyl-beta-D-mannosaminyltransferase
LVFANVHVIMEAFDNPEYRACLSRADMVNPDGVPLVWALRLLGRKNASRVYGPDCTLEMLKKAEEFGVPVGFYGSTMPVLDKMLDTIRHIYPSITITFAMSPPFHGLSESEDDAIVEQIIKSGTRILFVGLGCPKQEKWMMAHAGRIPAVMFAVGAAFDYIAGSKQQAPRWLMQLGLEWLFRLAVEPRRLAERYIKNNPRFVLLMARQLVSGRRQNEA